MGQYGDYCCASWGVLNSREHYSITEVHIVEKIKARNVFLSFENNRKKLKKPTKYSTEPERCKWAEVYETFLSDLSTKLPLKGAVTSSSLSNSKIM